MTAYFLENTERSNQMRKPEILAPAGDFKTLKTAIDAGADAVYAGGMRFGARAYAANFSADEVLSAIDYVHVRGKKLYLTVNTLIKEKEFEDLYEYLAAYYQQGLDAVIVQDFGVLSYIRSQFPDLPIHASTQMTVTGLRMAKLLEHQGVKRIVPARELSLEEVRTLCSNTALEVECFVHGALCYCYSGQCLMSSMIGGRSGNRGQCAQPCRLFYQTGTEKNGISILSLKDLNTIKHIPDLVEAGIDSFKIEGRMKQPEYVRCVTEMYRKYLDLYLEKREEPFKVHPSDIRILESVYQRRGYTDGYYVRHNGRQMISFDRPETSSEKGTSANEPKTDKNRTFREKHKEKINGKLILSTDGRDTLSLSCGLARVFVSEDISMKPINAPTPIERIRSQMLKTGDTPFVFDDLEIETCEDLFVSVGRLNEFRRNGLQKLEQAIIKPYRRKLPDRISAPMPKQPELAPETTGKPQNNIWNPMISACVQTDKQFRALLQIPEVSRIYLEDTLFSPEQSAFTDSYGDTGSGHNDLICAARKAGKQVWFAMARIWRKEAEDFYSKFLQDMMALCDGVLVRNVESHLAVKEYDPSYPVITDDSVYIWNLKAKDWVENLQPSMMTAPVELNRKELMDLDIRGMELVVYGKHAVMVSAGCVRKNTDRCDKKSGYLYMNDRRNQILPVKCECRYCYNVIYNPIPLMLLNRTEDLMMLNPSSVRLSFTTESAKDVRKITDLFIKNYLGNQTVNLTGINYTNGHFNRGVK